MHATPKSTVMVTGAGGNLGAKIVESLASHSGHVNIRALHSPRYSADSSAATEAMLHAGCDLTVIDNRWAQLLDDVDVIIHFGAQNPVPQSSWSDAAASFDMTANLVHEAARRGVRRFVFCSSNHVMGRYKDEPLAQSIGPGLLTEDLPPAPGTRWFNATEWVDATPYASSKLMSERLITSVAASSSRLCEAVSVRVGWAQPGDNDPRTISIAGTGTPAQSAVMSDPDPNAAADLKWFHDMWLSNDDLVRLFHAAAFAESNNWPSNHIVINGTSANSNSPWSTTAGMTLLGYTPLDDIYDHVSG